MPKEDLLLLAENITKTYPGVVALDKVRFELKKGEVHALIGENGAGKSTLIKTLMGIVTAEDGDIYIDGQKTLIKDPQDAAANGIAAVFQELSLIPFLSVGENVFLSKEGKGAKYRLNRKEIFEKTEAILKKYSFDQLSAKEMVANISPAKKQLAEIVKAIAGSPKILILDEPTSSLTESETNKLFEIIHILKSEGVGIVYISHRMNELEIIADRVSVLRDGKYIGSKNMNETSMDDIIQMMVGRSLELYQGNENRGIDYSNENKILEVKGISQKGRFCNVSFDLYKGEILGIAGLVGSGRSELMNILFGVDKADEGEIFIDGKKTHIGSVQDAMNCHIAMVPESRHQQGLTLIHSVSDNISLPIIKRFQKGMFLNHKQKNNFAEEMIGKYAVKTESSAKLAGQLSGGNQQKVVVAKWLATDPKILIIDEPTAGIDVHSKVEIHKMIRELTEKGLAVIMISSDMQELLLHSDGIMVMNDFKILGIFEKIEQEEIMTVIMKDKNNSMNRGTVSNV